MVDLYGEFNNSRFYHEARIDRRSADALIGLSAGITADGQVNQQEAEFLRDWISSNLAHLDDPVINLLYRRLSDMLADGVLDAEEASELLSTLRSFAGLGAGKPRAADNSFTPPTNLPLCVPAPELEWEGRLFVFTGVMAYGPRKDCEALVTERGGRIAPSVSKKISYLVVGGVGNEQWLHSTYGTKIKKAVEIREAGGNISIISEEHWQKALFG
ncbi:BRCT domain-containing protein [Pseudomonas sp. TTU2014-080ASC]|uniref:BRCT domain-containing protein n=1 Tax=Pseudomonas sp. TTU2014-080ASC TaxID=1729724 RepID=UPI0007183D77|nr:BRCT domain-containing protein [Pseudomonas sp. TTU2014-080ASC]KRW57867.1 NAD-dependent DNA ligase [Pseudomonas sp. TTU2014-080ASC]